MKHDTVRANAFAMPLVNPALPPLEVTEPVVSYEFIRVSDLAGFGDHTESAQIIPSAVTAKPAASSTAIISLIFYSSRAGYDEPPVLIPPENKPQPADSSAEESKNGDALCSD